MSGKPAARATDPTACPIPGHGSNPISAGSPDVLFDGLPAARQGDPTACGSTLASAVIPNVLINNMPAAVLGSVGSHGNSVVAGSGTVLIGTSVVVAEFTPIEPLIVSSKFDEQFLLKNSLGKPLANTKYVVLRQDGTMEKGVTDETGHTHRLKQHDAAEPIEIYIEL